MPDPPEYNFLDNKKRASVALALCRESSNVEQMLVGVFYVPQYDIYNIYYISKKVKKNFQFQKRWRPAEALISFKFAPCCEEIVGR